MKLPSKLRARRVFKGPILVVARALSSAGVRPITITYFSILLSLSAFLALVVTHSEPLYGILVFLVGFFDGVDGAVARIREMSSQQGAFADSITDKVSEFVILMAIIIAYPAASVFSLSVNLWVIVCMFGWIMTSYSRSRAETLGANDLDIGLGGRSERLLILVIMSLASMLLLGLVIVTFVGVLTAAYRFVHYSRQIY
ncbi:MAG: CDP-alcohol phosphatidyltransferase family protein [Candidatus Thorarchaeota archaeon]|nr:MAG: CDP-alcohol phosphatidyltransferase family protein [Candidatus Thorarchaeota archaeon]